ncbi:MAG: Spore coat [Ramlibacter sp.]|jgi:spore coat protein U-like protein|nr:Spore coat [Ramlibacter sp.]
MFRDTSLMHHLLKTLLFFLLAACGSAHAVICTVTATSMPMTVLYVSGANTNYTGTISGQCTKQAGDPARPYIYIGVDQGEPPAGRAMTRQNGTQTLTYNIYQGSVAGGQWTTGAGANYGSGTNGGVVYQMANNANAQPFTYTYYLRVPSGQTGAPAGVYDDLAISVIVRLSNIARSATGAILQSAVFGASVSIQHNCYFNTPPATLAMNYTSFMRTAATGASPFQLTCTYNTPYTLSLNSIPPPAVASANGTALGLNYTLTLTATSGTGSAVPQSYTVDGSMPPGQSGTCTTGVCTATNPHTLYIGF